MTIKLAGDERRTASRIPTTIRAVASSSHGDDHHVEINDLSVGGCAVLSVRRPLTAGAAYGVKISGLETLGATAAWANGSLAGLAFDASLHPAVADHFAALHPRAANESPLACIREEPE